MKKEEKIVLGTSFKSILDDKDEADVYKTLEIGQDSDFNRTDSNENTEISQDKVKSESELNNTEKETESAESLRMVKIDNIELLLSFIQESQDHLGNIETKILNLENSNDPDVIDDIFRSLHTLKGNSSFFGFENIKKLSHGLETILDNLRGGKIRINTELVDILLAGTDLLADMIKRLNKAASSYEESKGVIEISDWGDGLDSILSGIKRLGSTPGGTEKNTELISEEILVNFISESNDLLNKVEKDFLGLEKNPEVTELLDDAFRCIHTIKGNAGFLGQTELEKTCMGMESILDSVRSREKKINGKSISVLLNTIDSMRRVLDFMQNEETGTEKTKSINETEKEYVPVGEILVEMGETTTEVVEHALDMQDKKIGEILVAEGAVSEHALDKALQSQNKTISAVHTADRKNIRVDMWKLDKLFDLVGEMITAEAMIIHNPELERRQMKEQKMENFNRAAGYLGKITREMQEITMTMRMVPLEGLFNKMKRLVRDLSGKSGKNVNLVVSGQETEMDRNVIEKVSDPLIHIIRNSIDHGIKEAGSIRLSARYEGNEIWILIKDDGAGLNRSKILAKAQQQGLLKADAENLPDSDIWQLIFKPGFSTADKVSEISGRGVGMDVVKRNIEELKGKIEIKSILTEGTEIILKIPLTLAIMDGITVKVDDILYAITLNDILEFHKASDGQVIRTDNHREVLKLRKEIIPVIKLKEFFKTNSDETRISDGILIITRAGNRKAALLVDEIVGYQQIVVKALPQYISDMRAVSGCSIMGNGEVSLIIDMGSLLKYELE